MKVPLARTLGEEVGVITPAGYLLLPQSLHFSLGNQQVPVRKGLEEDPFLRSWIFLLQPPSLLNASLLGTLAPAHSEPQFLCLREGAIQSPNGKMRI